MICLSKTRRRLWLIQILMAVGLSILAGIVQAEEGARSSDWWPMFGHDARNSGYSRSTVPDTPEVLWQVSTSTYYPAMPVILDGKVYAVQDDGLSCFDAVTGQQYWHFDIPPYSISTSISVAGDEVYLGASAVFSAAIYCLNADTGEVVWSELISSGWYNYVAAYDPIVCNGRLLYRTYRHEDYGYYVETDQDLILCNRSSGDIIWSKNFGETYFEHPVLVNNKDLFITVESRLRKYNALGGSFIWEASGYFLGTPVFADNRIYGRSWGAVVCLNGADGEVLWSYQAAGSGTPAVGDGRVYTAMSDGRFLCLDAETGEEIWARLYDQVDFSDVSAGLDKVLVMTSDSFLRCLDAGTGDANWTFPMPYSSLDRPIAIADGRVYVSGQDKILYCLGEAPVTIIGSMQCNPGSGTLPFQTNMSLTLHNSYLNQSRWGAVAIDVTLGDGTQFPNWRSGYTNLQPGESKVMLWQMTIPDYQPLVGENNFQLCVEDVTPAPYNQPPYPPAGDTCTDTVVVTGISP